MTNTESAAEATAVCIAALNDALRKEGTGGKLLITRGVNAKGPDFVAAALAAMRDFSAFTPDNDPYGEHDFGSFKIGGETVDWKIDYYAPGLVRGSEDPSDPAKTERVLTLLLSEEY